MAVAAWTFATAAEFKVYTGMTGSTNDTLIESLLDRCASYIEDVCDRRLISRTYTEYYDGDGGNKLILPTYPITSVTSLYDDVLRVYGASTLVPASYYLIYGDAGKIVRHSSTFGIGMQNIKIVYVAGYLSSNDNHKAPLASLKNINIRIAEIIWKECKVGDGLMMIGGKSLSDNSIAQIVRKHKEYSDIIGILNRYTRRGI